MTSSDFTRALNSGLEHAMVAYARGRGLPYLHWHLAVTPKARMVLVGFGSSGDYDDTERVRAVQLWVDHLGFTDDDLIPEPLEHTIEWYRELDGIPVYLWAITDELAWETANAPS